MTEAPLCMACETPAELTDSRTIYPHRQDLWHKRRWKCPVCPDSHVGCHGETTDPLGRPAGPDLRKHRMATHAVLDPLWRSRDGSRTATTRSHVYGFLRYAMNLKRTTAHVGLFDEAQCTKAQAVLSAQTPESIEHWARENRAYLRLPDEEL